MNLYSASFSWRLRSNRFVIPLDCFTLSHSLPGTLCASAWTRLWNCRHKSRGRLDSGQWQTHCSKPVKGKSLIQWPRRKVFTGVIRCLNTKICCWDTHRKIQNYIKHWNSLQLFCVCVCAFILMWVWNKWKTGCYMIFT